MGNIIDYVKEEFRTIEEKEFNQVDSLVLSQFSYLLFDGIVPGFERICGETRIKDLYKAEYFSSILPHNNSEDDNRQLLFAIAASPRFRDMTLCYYVNDTDQEMEKQFAAISIGIQHDTKYIAFRGTDSTLVGWKEDFNMAFMTPVPAQAEALAYTKRVAEETEKIILGGHSKGGNLAVYAGINSPKEIQEKIVKIYSHDGPGFNDDVIEQSNYDAVVERIDKTIPGASIVGMLLRQKETSQIVESDAIGIAQHNPYSWLVENGEFVHVEKLSRGAELLNVKIDQAVDGMDDEERKVFVERLFGVLEAGENFSLSDIADNMWGRMSAMTKAITGLEPNKLVILRGKKDE